MVAHRVKLLNISLSKNKINSLTRFRAPSDSFSFSSASWKSKYLRNTAAKQFLFSLPISVTHFVSQSSGMFVRSICTVTSKPWKYSKLLEFSNNQLILYHEEHNFLNRLSKLLSWRRYLVQNLYSPIYSVLNSLQSHQKFLGSNPIQKTVDEMTTKNFNGFFTALLSRRSFPYYQKFPNVVGDDWSFLCGYIAIFVSLKFRRTKTERAERLLSCSQHRDLSCTVGILDWGISQYIHRVNDKKECFRWCILEATS